MDGACKAVHSRGSRKDSGSASRPQRSFRTQPMRPIQADEISQPCCPWRSHGDHLSCMPICTTLENVSWAVSLPLHRWLLLSIDEADMKPSPCKHIVSTSAACRPDLHRAMPHRRCYRRTLLHNATDPPLPTQSLLPLVLTQWTVLVLTPQEHLPSASGDH